MRQEYRVGHLHNVAEADDVLVLELAEDVDLVHHLRALTRIVPRLEHLDRQP